MPTGTGAPPSSRPAGSSHRDLPRPRNTRPCARPPRRRSAPPGCARALRRSRSPSSSSVVEALVEHPELVARLNRARAGDVDFGGTIGVQNVGDTDTIVQRPFAASGPGIDSIPIEMVSLQLESVVPIDLVPLEGRGSAFWASRSGGRQHRQHEHRLRLEDLQLGHRHQFQLARRRSRGADSSRQR